MRRRRILCIYLLSLSMIKSFFIKRYLEELSISIYLSLIRYYLAQISISFLSIILFYSDNNIKYIPGFILYYYLCSLTKTFYIFQIVVWLIKSNLWDLATPLSPVVQAGVCVLGHPKPSIFLLLTCPEES